MGSFQNADLAKPLSVITRQRVQPKTGDRCTDVTTGNESALVSALSDQLTCYISVCTEQGLPCAFLCCVDNKKQLQIKETKLVMTYEHRTALSKTFL